MSAGVIKDLGPCQLVFDSVDLGKTMGNVSFKYTPESKDVKEDQAGVSPVDSVFVGAVTELIAPLTRASLAQLAKVIPGATASANTMRVSNPVGTSRYDTAKVLIIKPYVNNVVSTDPTNWLTLLKASPSVDLDVSYSYEGQRVFKVAFKAFPSQATPIGEIWKIG